jgi:hypothetical protein
METGKISFDLSRSKAVQPEKFPLSYRGEMYSEAVENGNRKNFFRPIRPVLMRGTHEREEFL